MLLNQAAPAATLLSQRPKRVPATGHGPSHWFGYYAGYSPTFVQEAIAYLNLRKADTVADPWNGSGTSTEVIREQGMIGRGFDINHAVVLVAKARLLGADIKPSHLSICNTIVASSRRLTEPGFLPEEPLTAWFSPGAAAAIRGIERAIQSVLIPTPRYTRLASLSSLESVSTVAAFFYVALFRTVRGFLDRFKTSNPTWIKDASSAHARLRPPTEAICNAFRREVRLMFDTAGPKTRAVSRHPTTAEVGESTSIPLDAGSVAAVISSPPYCTRIDYAVATKPELAVLAATREEFQALRLAMLGTPLTAGILSKPAPCWGAACNKLLHRIKEHPSRASATYYYNNHVIYFDRLFRSLGEISRILRPRGRCILVLQDSYYKNLHNDLARITVEMSGEFGLGLRKRHDRQLSASMAALNTRSLRYRAHSAATESVLAFTRI